MYRLDLRDVWRPGGGQSRLTWRRLRVLADRLPPESHFRTGIRDGLTAQQWESLQEQESDPAWGRWSKTESLLGSLVDGVNRMCWLLVAVNAEKGKQPPEPKPLDRPGVGAPLHAAAEMLREKRFRQVAYLKALEANSGAEPAPEQIQSMLDQISQAGGDRDA